jgi:predicted transcriptional regulator of viral defense system
MCGDIQTMNAMAFFLKNPVFRYEEFAAWKIEQGTSNPRSIISAIQHYIKTGRLLTVRRGIFAFIPPGETKSSIQIDPYILSSKIAPDSILAYHSALDLHGFAYSVFQQFTFLTPQKNKPFEFREQWFQPVSIPSLLKKKGQSDFGIQLINRFGVDIKVTGPERTFVDVLDRVELSGGWEEVCRSIVGMVVLNVDHVIEYCLLLENATLAAKVGYFLEQRQGAFAAPLDKLSLLQNVKPKSPQYIADRHQESHFNSKWNLIIPLAILNQSWEEPHYDI